MNATAEATTTKLHCNGLSTPDQSPTAKWVVAARRFTCRECGEQKDKGTRALSYSASHTAGVYDPWKAVNAKVCESCVTAHNDGRTFGRWREMY